MLTTRSFIFHIAPAMSVVSDMQDDCQYIIISTGSRFDALEGKDNVCLLHFADTELAGRPDACNEEDVRRISEHLAKWTYPDIFVCCDAGESRSPAVAAGLLRCFGQDDSYIWQSDEYRPNVHVYRTILSFFPSKISTAASYPFEAPASVKSELREIEEREPEEYRTFRASAGQQ